MAEPAAGFIDADGLHIGHVHMGTRLGNVVVYHPPESLVGLPDQLGDSPYGHLPDHGLEEQRESRSL